MTAQPRQAILNLFTSNMHRGSWRRPGAPPDQWMNYDLYRWYAQTAERGKLHSLFIADTVSIVYSEADEDVLARSSWLLRPEPLTLGAALAATTEHVGLIMTANTTYNQPYNVARMFAQLDHISGGRAGWNIVTSHMADEPANFGTTRLDHATRYERALEFYRVTEGLWDSWDADAFVLDQESGRYLDATKMHVLGHEGEFFSVKGPLNVSRSPQVSPVIAQAGASPDGLAFAVKVTEILFTLQSHIDTAKASYARIKSMMGDAGRSPDQLKILPLLSLVVAPTAAEASERLAQLDNFVDPVVGVNLLSQQLYFDLTGFPLDGPLPEIPVSGRAQGQQQFTIDLARREKMTIRQLAQLAGRGGTTPLAGGPTEVADYIEEWVREEAADGFNLTFPDASDSLPYFVDLVVPELQRRGVFREDYLAGTLRDNFGLEPR